MTSPFKQNLNNILNIVDKYRIFKSTGNATIKNLQAQNPAELPGINSLPPWLVAPLP